MSVHLERTRNLITGESLWRIRIDGSPAYMTLSDVTLDALLSKILHHTDRELAYVCLNGTNVLTVGSHEAVERVCELVGHAAQYERLVKDIRAQTGLSEEVDIEILGTVNPTHSPRRGSDVEEWIKRWRDRYDSEPSVSGHVAFNVLDDLLDAYRLAADTSTPLTDPLS